jgi:hypothetical protein
MASVGNRLCPAECSNFPKASETDAEFQCKATDSVIAAADGMASLFFRRQLAASPKENCVARRRTRGS